MGGYDRNTTPNLQRIASLPKGTAFTQCIATAKWSLASVASMLTGTYPEYHGMDHQTEVLPRDIETVPELLAEQGYQTSGLSINTYFSEPTGLDRGFKWFKKIDVSNFLRVAGFQLFLNYALGLRRHSAGFTLDKRKHRPDYLVNELGKDRLKSLKGTDEPFFFMLHYHGAHIPYYPPIPYQDAYTDEIALSTSEARDVAFEHTTDILEEIAMSQTYAPEEWEAISAMYDALIAYTDDLVGDFFDYMMSLDLENTIIVITADHGDLLGEYGLLSHKLVLHDALTRVPLVVYGSDDLLGRGDELVQHPDIMQMLVASVGGRTDQFQGIDLREQSREFAVSQRKTRVSERLDTIESYNSNFDRSAFHESGVTALRTTEFKYQRSDHKSELFKLPDELEDVSAKHPDETTTFDQLLTKWIDEHGGQSHAPATAEFSDTVKQQLADLGYTEK